MYLSSSAKYSGGSSSAVWKFDGSSFSKIHEVSGMSHMGNVNGSGDTFIAVTTKEWKGSGGGATLQVSCGGDSNWKEKHVFGETDEKAGEYAEDLAASMLASTLGIEFNSDQAWDERAQIFKMSGKIVKTTNITQSAQGNKNGLWTTVIAAVVFVCSK